MNTNSQTHPRVTIGGAEVSVEATGSGSQALLDPNELKVVVEQVPDHTVYQVDDSQQRFNTGVAISGMTLLGLVVTGLLVWLLIRALRARK